MSFVYFDIGDRFLVSRNKKRDSVVFELQVGKLLDDIFYKFCFFNYKFFVIRNFSILNEGYVKEQYLCKVEIDQELKLNV